ncbi:MAG: hypothetical protein VB082_01275 [Christensenella sp.]|nr:hypothetical protein [Christensenella sp.]
MEQTVKKKSNKNIGIIIISILIIVLAVGMIVSLIGYLQAYEQSAQLGLTTMDYVDYFVYNIYMIGGLMGVCALLLVLSWFIAKEKREVLSKIWFWGILLTTVLYLANFFPALIQGTFSIEVFAFYLPWLALAVGCVALLANWDNSNKKNLNFIEFTCLAVSIVFSAFFFYQKLTSLMSTEALAIYSVVIPLIINAMVNLLLVQMFLVTASKRKFDKAILAMTDEEADIVERIEARVDEIASEVEEMAAEGEALVEAEEALEEAAEDAESIEATETIVKEDQPNDDK